MPDSAPAVFGKSPGNRGGKGVNIFWFSMNLQEKCNSVGVNVLWLGMELKNKISPYNATEPNSPVLILIAFSML